MALSVTIVWPTFADGVPLTLPSLRRPATISLAGSVGIAEVVGNWPASRMVPDAYWYAPAVFATDTYAVTLSPALTALANGVEVAFKADAVCVAASLLNVNSLGAKPLFTSFNVAVLAGDIRANQVVQVRYNTSLGASGGWQILSQSGNPPHRYITSAGSANAYTATYAPSCASLAAIAGVPLRFKANFTNTGAATLAVDGLTAKAIKHRGNIALGGGEIVTNALCEVVYDVTLDVFTLTSEPANLAPAVPAAAQNLVLAKDSGSPNSKVDITADALVLVDTLNNHFLATAVAVEANMAVTGSAGRAADNGLDTGAEANSTLYYLWVVSNGTTVNALLSLSASAPSMPAGYGYKALVGAVYNGSGGDFEGLNTYLGVKSFVSAEITVPAATGTTYAPHALGQIPKTLRWVLRCKTTELGYAVGDEVDALSAIATTTLDVSAYSVSATSTSVAITTRSVYAGIDILNISTGVQATLTNANWKLVAYATL